MVKRKPPKPIKVVAAAPPPKAPHILSERFSDPDLVDRVFDYVVLLLPELAPRRTEVTEALRDEFGGLDKVYIRKGRTERSAALVGRVLVLFNGRNATEVARALNISRPTVYRLLKQAGDALRETVSLSPKT